MTRAQRAKRAAELKATKGLNGKEIAVVMRISQSYAYELLSDPTGDGARARKGKYDKACSDCGTRIDGTTPGKSAGRCVPCANRRSADARRVWTHELILERIREWAAIHGEPPAIPDWNPYLARHQIHDEARARRFEDADHHWPWFVTVIRAFGTWNAAIRAAGFEPRSNHGGNGNLGRRRDQRAQQAPVKRPFFRRVFRRPEKVAA